MFKKFAKSLILSSVGLSVFLLLFSCSVGLGESVDTEVPKVEVTYPPASSTIRDWFYLAGNCSDDKGVASLTVSATNTKTNEEFSLGTVTPENDGTWQIKINEADSNGDYKLKDGTYTFTVVAKDTSGQKSQPGFGTFDIDNTAPVFVIRNPGTTKAESPSSFGSILKIVGAAADEHEIYELELKVYASADMSGEPKATLVENNVDNTDGINVTLARYNPDVALGTASADELHNNYLNVYDVEGGGDQQLYASVTLKDSAGVWQNPSHTSADSIGNSTSGGLYLNDDIYDDLMSKKSKYGLSATDFMKIINGTYNEAAAETSANSKNTTLKNSQTSGTDYSKITDDEIQNILAVLTQKKTETSVTPLSFKLNKDANPTYEIMGFAFDDSEAETFASHKAAKKSSLTFKAQAGLDGTYVKPSTLKVYMFGPYSSCTVEQLNEIRTEPESYYSSAVEKAKEQLKAAGNENPSEELVEATSNARILADYSENSSSSTETFTETIELPSTITKGSFYVLAASGSDIDGLPLLTQNNYGFVGESAGTPPAIVIDGFADGAMTNVLGNVKLSGTLESEETELAGVTYSIVVFDEINAKNVATITGEANFNFKDSKLSADWNIADFSNGGKNYVNGYSSFEPEDGKRFKYSVTVSGKDRTGLESKDTKSFTVDMKKPEIKINDITPVAKKETETSGAAKYIVNGTVKFSAVATDTNLQNVKATVSDGTKTETLFDGNNSTIEKYIDTTEFTDNSTLTFKVVATDSAGNVSEGTRNDVFVNQTTDRPVIYFSNGKTAAELGDGWTNVTNGQNVFGIENNNSANFTITDDDGLSSIKLTIYDENGKIIGTDGAVSVTDAQLQAQSSSKNAAQTAQNPVEYEVDGSTSYSVSYVLPKTAGKYKIQLDVLDTGYATASAANQKWHTTTAESYILVSEGNFSISLMNAENTENNSFVISNNETLVKAAVNTTISGKIELSSLEKLANIERYAMKKQTTDGETTWSVEGTAQAKYKSSEGESVSDIEAKVENGKIVWTDTIPSASIKDGVQHFYYKATAVAGNSSSVELVLRADGKGPSLAKDTNVLKDNEWKNSSSVVLSVIAADIKDSADDSEASGIEKVTYSYKIGTDTVSGELARGKACDANGNESASEKNYYKYSTTINDFAEAESTTIEFAAEDKVGNRAVTCTHVMKVDLTTPEKVELKIDENQCKKNTDKITVSYAFKDSTSGIKKIEFCTNSKFTGNTLVTESVSVKEYGTSDSPKTIEIPLTGLSDSEYSIYVRATDNAGNVSEVMQTSSFVVDTTAPKVKITSHTKAGTQKNDQSALNNKVTFSGTIADNNVDTLKTPKLQFYSNSKWNDISVVDGSFTCDGQTWSLTFDTTTEPLKSAGKGTYAFQVAFTDKAGNTNLTTEKPAEDYEYQFKVDIDADRPIITFSDISSFKGSVISRSSFKGFVSDDDGDVKGMWYISSGTYNASKLLPTTSSDNGWTKIDVAQTTGDWEITLTAEGENSFEFCVIDSVGTTFCTQYSTATNGTRLKIGTETQSDSQSVKFTYDKTPPAVKVSYAHGTSSGATSDYVTTNSVFGASEYLYVKAVVTEAVGLADNPLTLELGGETKTVTFTAKSTASPYEYISGGISINGMTGGSVQIAVTAKDKAGLEGKGIEQITIDTDAPTIKIVSPEATISNAITGAATIKGIAQDNASSISRIRYLIPTVDQKKLYDSTGTISSGWKEVGNSNSWEILFASGAEESSDSLLYYVAAKEDNKNVYAVELYGTKDENLWKVPIYFMVKDTCGNEAIRTKDSSGKELYVIVDPDGGTPKVWVNSPEEGSTTSGLVTIYGGASDDVSVKDVRIQIDANGDGSFDSEDYNLINSSTGVWAGTEVQKNLKGDSSNWYILANGTNSWKRSVETGNITKSSDGKTYLRFRASSYDEEGKTRGWSNVVTVNIDSEVPVIKDLKVVQYGTSVTADSSNVSTLTAVTEQEYISGMYISDIMAKANGTFYLVGTISDNEKVKTVSFAKQTTSSSVNNIDLGLTDVENSTATYNLCIPLKTDESGQINYIIKAKDDNTGETSQSVVINIDSTKPGMYKTGGAESTEIGSDLRLLSLNKKLGTESGNSTVVNSNGYFTFGDTVVEAGSGLAYIVATFERNGSAGGKRIYNPMKSDTKLALASSENESSISAKPYISSEGFAVQSFDVTREDGDEYSIKSENFKTSSTAAFIQKGGLVRIAGTYCLITDFDASSGKITLSKSVSTSFTKAELIFGQVIDHQIVETLKTDGGVENDDGDGMVETITYIGSSYTWTASVDSTNIPDGPLTIHVVAIDKAGNINYGSIATKVENNRPRIAKVMLATDLNGNSKFDYDASSAPITGLDSETVNNRTADGAEFGEFSFYSAMDSKSTNLKSEVELKSGSFKVISGLAVLPEFVGGNGSLGYILNQSSSNSGTDYTAKAIGTVTTLTSKDNLKSGGKFADKSTNASGVTYEDLISDKGGIVLDSVTSGYLSFTFWDSTEETTPGTDSQWAHLMIPVTVLSNETENPVPTITPFYWEGKTENSVYKDDGGNLLGHIELEDDLTSEIMKAYGDNSSLKKPKVSGQIKIEGTVTDNVRISSINMSFAGLFDSTKLAEYSSGSWQTVSSLPTGGVISFSAEDVSISQKGHEAKYTLVVDTEKLTGVAGKDKNITISATDWKSNTSAAGTAQTTASAKTAKYTVDVVPYVTGIGTELSAFYRSASSVYARTSTGRYPLHEDESITFYGFNLGTPTVALNGTTLSSGGTEVSLSDIVSGSNKATRTTGTTAKSGAFTVSVNSLNAINNMNDNSKEYNQQPNNVNNNTLTDDLYADVWQFKNAAEPKNGKISKPHMKIGPDGQIGFSFSNAVLYYSMPGYSNGGSTLYSQTKMGMNYGGFTNNTFAYDKNGKAYGAALCIDTGGTPGMSANFQFFSRQDGIGDDLNSNYSNQKYGRRIENTTVSVDGTSYTTNIDRVQSPSMATYTNGDTSYIYVAYYDDITKQIRFRTGTVGSDANDIGGGLQDLLAFKSGAGTSEDWPRIRAEGSSLKFLRDSISGYVGIPTATEDFSVNETCGAGSSYSAGKIYNGDKGDAYKYVSVPAASGVSSGNTYYKKSTTISAGSYVAVGALSDGTAVLAWYDELNGRLAFSYNSKINSGYTTLYAGTKDWQDNAWYVTDSSIRAGWYVSMAVDASDGVHLAYYSPSGADLYYSYIKNPKTDKNATKTVMVDSYQQVGTYCSIDVGRNDSSSAWIPYISYKCESNNGTSASAKVAYPVNFDSDNNVLAGVDGKDYFTGNWEVSIVPALTTPTTDFVNVGINKGWSDGVIKTFSSGTTTTSSLSYKFPVSDSTIVYGNGTSNPVVSYAVSENGVLEMAQKK